MAENQDNGRRLTRIRQHLAIYFCLHRGSLPEDTAKRQPQFRDNTRPEFLRKTICQLKLHSFCNVYITAIEASSGG